MATSCISSTACSIDAAPAFHFNESRRSGSTRECSGNHLATPKSGFTQRIGSDRDRALLSPLLPWRVIPEFLDAACPGFAMDLILAGMRRLPLRARRRYAMAASIGWVISVVVVAAVVWRFFEIPVWWVLAALAITPLFVWLGVARYRDAGWHVDNGGFLLRWRMISRVTILTQVRRLQYREMTADPFQRRAGLVTFRTAVASGASRKGFSLPHLDVPGSGGVGAAPWGGNGV